MVWFEFENEDLLRLSEFDICCEAYAYTPRHQTPNANMGVDFQITQGLCSSRYSVYAYMRVQKQTIKKLRHKIISIAASQLRAPS